MVSDFRVPELELKKVNKIHIKFECCCIFLTAASGRLNDCWQAKDGASGYTDRENGVALHATSRLSVMIKLKSPRRTTFIYSIRVFHTM